MPRRSAAYAQIWRERPFFLIPIKLLALAALGRFGTP
jgi:hypothetical protein